MKLLRYGLPGCEKPGLLDDNGQIRDLSGLVRDIGEETLLPESLERLLKTDASALPKIRYTVRIGACVGRVGKFICIGLNYSDHVAEAGASVPTDPVLFMKATSALCGPNDDVMLPLDAKKADWEVELGVVIGKPGKCIEERDALSHVAGYCVVNDLSERAFQLEGTGQWVKGKIADTFGPIGPWLVTADEVLDPPEFAPLARGGWPSLSEWIDFEHDLRSEVSGQLRQSLHESALRRHYFYRHAA